MFTTEDAEDTEDTEKAATCFVSRKRGRKMDRAKIDAISGNVVDAAMRVHSAIGPGLLESSYEACLAYELRSRGLRVATQVPIPLVYRQVVLDVGYRADMIVEKAVLVELKSVAKIQSIHDAQMIGYLKLSGCDVGLLINFNVRRLKDGISRFVNDVQSGPPRPPCPPR